MTSPKAEAPLTITLREEHYPFWIRTFTIRRAELFAIPTPETPNQITVATQPPNAPPRPFPPSPP